MCVFPNMSDVLYRPLDEKAKGELNLVRKTWIRYIKQQPTSLLDKHYATAAKRTVEDVLAREHCAVIVAEYAYRKGQLLGFVVYETDKEQPLLHCLYVKKMFREVAPHVAVDLLALARADKPGVLHYTCKHPAMRDYPEARLVSLR